MPKLVVDVWSDIMCPFCYLGDAVLSGALAEFPHARDVEVRYHSFQLMPDLTAEPADMMELLKGRYDEQQLQRQHEHFKSEGAKYGLEYNFDDALAVNTAKAHELHHFASTKGLGQEIMEAIFAAHFTEGKNVADVEQLVDIAGNVGLDAEEARQALNSGRYAADVEADVARAAELGIRGVPFFIFDNKYALSGAQPKEAFAEGLNRAWSELEVGG